MEGLDFCVWNELRNSVKIVFIVCFRVCEILNSELLLLVEDVRSRFKDVMFWRFYIC